MSGILFVGGLSFRDGRIIIVILCLLALRPKVVGGESYQFFHFLVLLINIVTGTVWDLPYLEGDPHKETWRKPLWDYNLELNPGWSLAAFYFFEFTTWFIKEQVVLFITPPILCDRISFSCSMKKNGCVWPQLLDVEIVHCLIRPSHSIQAPKVLKMGP